ncbi:MAG: imidazolonepropionase [Saprospiraceae bacterium]|nr:imidazolonepropionase [Saprospiraceae bacterium]
MANTLDIIRASFIWGTYITTPGKPVSGHSLNELPYLENGFISIVDGRIRRIGLMSEYTPVAGRTVMDASGAHILPAWCDSHTHLVHAASREKEFEMRLRGKSYEEIAAAGGGILNSADVLRAMEEEELFDLSYRRFQAVQKLGTGAIEIKSGYGLDFDSEVKMLRVIRRLKEKNEIPVKSTFLGAHAFPREFKDNHPGYISLIIDKMLPYIADHGLADYIDVFCDRGFFTPEQTARIMDAGAKYGLKPKIHANELAVSGGVEIGVAHNAVSVDHLEEMDEHSIEALSGSDTIGTMLPGCAFFLGIPFPKARTMIEADAKLALATDYNPGTAPSGNMNMVVSLACIRMKMTPQEAINAATINGAFAMESQQMVGSITPGKLANLIITGPMASLAYFPYSFGDHPIDKVLINGRVI